LPGVTAVHRLDELVVLPVRLEEVELRLLPVQLAQAEEQRGLLLLIRREGDDLLERLDLLAALGGDLPLHAETELVVLERGRVVLLLLLAADVASERLVHHGSGALLAEVGVARRFLVLRVGRRGQEQKAEEERAAHGFPLRGSSGQAPCLLGKCPGLFGNFHLEGCALCAVRWGRSTSPWGHAGLLGLAGKISDGLCEKRHAGCSVSPCW
jgi:hypothetical protein